MGVLLGLLAAATAWLFAGGCYRHVIKDEGYTGKSEELHEPNLPDEPGLIDQVLWGEQPSKDGRRQ